MAAKSGKQQDDVTFKRALEVLPEEAICLQAAEVGRVLAEIAEPNTTGGTGFYEDSCSGADIVRWGTAFPTDEYVSANLKVGLILFDCVDFGENLKLSTIPKQKLRIGEDVETKKCKLLALAAAVEWASHGQPKRCPARRRIDVLASGIRIDGILGAEQSYEQTVGIDSDTAREIQSICHDVMTADHERGYQALGMFLLPSVWKYLACDVVTVEIEANDHISFHTYPACPTATESVIFLIAHQCHMMWGKPTAATTCTSWRDWEMHLAAVAKEVIHPVVSWKLRVRDELASGLDAGRSVVTPRRHCGLAIEVGLTLLSVGTVGGVDTGHRYPKISLGGRAPE